MNIQAIQIEVVPAKTVTLTSIVPTLYREFPTRRQLFVSIEGVEKPYEFAEAEYDALGQWTDNSIKEAIRVKIGATAA